MSVQTEIDRIITAVGAAYKAAAGWNIWADIIVAM